MTKAVRKIALMHKFFGIELGHSCRECSNLIKGKYHDRTLCKCKVYGQTHSEASDWAGRWQACGMFNKPWGKDPMIQKVVPNRQEKAESKNTPLDGQIQTASYEESGKETRKPMNVYDASEIAYKNGYEAGKRETIDQLTARITEQRDKTLGLDRAALDAVLEMIQDIGRENNNARDSF